MCFLINGIKRIIKKIYVQLTVAFIVLLVAVVFRHYSMWHAVFPWILSVVAGFTISNILAQQKIQKMRERSQHIDEQRIQEFNRHERELMIEFERQRQEIISEFTGIVAEAVRQFQIMFARERRRKLLEDQIEALKRKLEDLRQNLYAFIDDTRKTAEELDSLSYDLDEHFKRIKASKIGGASISIVGGIVSVVGFALLFPTFGASIIVTAVGCTISAAGGVIVGGSSAVDAVLSMQKRKKVEERLNEFKKRKDAVLLACRAVSAILECSGNIDIKFPNWVSFWARLVIGGFSVTKNITWDIIIKNIFAAIRLSSLADDVARVGVQAVGTGVKVAGIAGGVIGILLLPLDIYTLVDSAVKVHKKTPHELSQKIRGIAIELRNDCPTFEQVDIMIQSVINNYRNQIEEEYRQTDFQNNVGYLAINHY